MAHVVSLSRRPCGPCQSLARHRVLSIRTIIASAAACEPQTTPAEQVAEAPVVGRDRTSDASTSPRGSSAISAKAKRVSPTSLKPGIIEDVEVFQNAAILVNKPLGWTSFDVCGKIRSMVRFLGVKKVGHAGTLDPNATGLLIVCTGLGTKFCDDFQAQDKEYSGTFRLGEGTASYDAETEVSERAAWEHITDAEMEAAAMRFVGNIMQVPPMFSAIKVGGQKLYNLAREGQSVELPPRPVTISSLRVWRSEANRQDVHFYVGCSKGTYVRSLAYDMGRALGSAAHLVALQREAVGEYRLSDAWDMRQLVEQLTARKQAFLAQQQLAAAQASEEAAAAATVVGSTAASGV